MEQVTFAGLVCNFDTPTSSFGRVLQMASQQVVKFLRTCSCRHDPTQ
jgi:hypothetical protein